MKISNVFEYVIIIYFYFTIFMNDQNVFSTDLLFALLVRPSWSFLDGILLWCRLTFDILYPFQFYWSLSWHRIDLLISCRGWRRRSRHSQSSTPYSSNHYKEVVIAFQPHQPQSYCEFFLNWPWDLCIRCGIVGISLTAPKSIQDKLAKREQDYLQLVPVLYLHWTYQLLLRSLRLLLCLMTIYTSFYSYFVCRDRPNQRWVELPMLC